jgi:DNA adenine methylase
MGDTLVQPLKIQPIPYQGSKRSLAPRVCQLFPNNIETLYEPFAGSAAITIYAAHHKLANRFVIGDVYPELIALWDLIINDPEKLASEYKDIWNAQFAIGQAHFNNVRAEYNQTRNPVALLYLIARCVKNAVRFNKKGEFTQSADKRRNGLQPERLQKTLHDVSKLLKGKTTLYTGDFSKCIESASELDLVYMDPPYQGTTYGADKRYAEQLERMRLIETLHNMNDRNVPFILSYDGKTGEKTYGEPLPDSVDATHLHIHAGLSSQATLSGRREETIESLYVSKNIDFRSVNIYKTTSAQYSLFD